MPALNFQERFAESVKLGLIDRHAPSAKTCSIRPERKRPIKPKDSLYLFVNQRTKKCERLGQSICDYVSRLRIDRDGIFFLDYCSHWLKFTDDSIAILDGFQDWFEMRDWFEQRYGLPFTGVLIEW